MLHFPGLLMMFPLIAVAGSKRNTWTVGNRTGTSRTNFPLHSILPESSWVLHHIWKKHPGVQYQPDDLPTRRKFFILTISFTLISLSSIFAIFFQRLGMHQHLEHHTWRRWLRSGSNELGKFVCNVVNICFFTWLGRRVVRNVVDICFFNWLGRRVRNKDGN